MSDVSEELRQIRAGIEVLKRRLLEQILCELEERVRIRESREETRLRINTVGDEGTGIMGPARPARRVKP